MTQAPPEVPREREREIEREAREEVAPCSRVPEARAAPSLALFGDSSVSLCTARDYCPLNGGQLLARSAEVVEAVMRSQVRLEHAT